MHAWPWDALTHRTTIAHNRTALERVKPVQQRASTQKSVIFH